ncbi:MAG: hypothetical protein Kow0080_07260 [Candidatus Promineifilaceae bacterium]
MTCPTFTFKVIGRRKVTGRTILVTNLIVVEDGVEEIGCVKMAIYTGAREMIGGGCVTGRTVLIANG